MDKAELIEIVVRKKAIITEDDASFCLDEVEQAIKNYCSIPEIPLALKYTWCNMAVDLAVYNYETNTKPDDVLESFDPSDVSTIKLGDTSISLGDKYRSNARSRVLQSHQANLDSIIMNYNAILNNFRRIW